MKTLFFVAIFLIAGSTLKAQYPINKVGVRKMNKKEYKKYILNKKFKEQKKIKPFVYMYV